MANPEKAKVFIDGAHGTTGLQIRQYLSKRQDLQVLEIEEAYRKDVSARLSIMAEADVSILCLPDDAAMYIAEKAPDNVRIIDTSTAHRVKEGWVYGLPEVTGRNKIAGSNRVANPGCHATGFILLTEPLVSAGLIGSDSPLTCFCVTGYSGGGKKMIADYEDANRMPGMEAPAQYALGQTHKHLPEMMKITGLSKAPHFCPVVGDFPRGMVMTVPLPKELLKKDLSLSDLKELYGRRYEGEPLVSVSEVPEGGFLYGAEKAGKNDLEILVTGNEERPLLIARYDNLGKGASGAAVQNLNLMLGREETTGLTE